MSVDPSLKHIQRQLAIFLLFIQRRVFGPTARQLFTSLLKRLALSFRFLRSIWQILRERRWKRVESSSSSPTKPKVDEEYGSTIDAGGQSQTLVSQTAIDNQIVISLDDVACSLYPSSNGLHHGLHDASGSRSSQSPEMFSRDRNTPGSLHPDGSYLPMYTTHLVSSPIADTHRPANLHHRLRGDYRSDSGESIEQLGSGEMSSSRDVTLVAPSHISINVPEKSPHQETLISSPTSPTSPAVPNDISPVAPEYFTRYEKRRKIPQAATTVTMNPLLRDFSDHDDIPGWELCDHPEGGRYFYHAEKRIFTDADLHDPASFDQIKQAVDIIDDFISEHDIQMPKRLDLALDLNEDNGKQYIDYYFADHELRIVVFLHDFSSDYLPKWNEIKGVSSGTHLRQALEAQYWWHCQAYPNCIELSHDLICELRDLVIHYIGDCTTSPTANSPFTLAKLEKILSYTDSLKENVGKPYHGCISALSRFMHQISSTRYLNFHGQPEARLSRDQSVYGEIINRRTWFIKSISIFLFSAPDIHLRNLQGMWIDRITHQAVWEESLKKVIDEWREFILYATVLLNGNVGFLAIQSVDTNRAPYRSAAQISSYCSVCFSIGSIILGLLLVRQNQTKHKDTAQEVQEFLRNKAHPWLGLETVAIMFSLPYAMLMWGMVFFLVAFLLTCLQDSGPATRSVIVTVSSLILILTIWCIWTSWEQQAPCNAEHVEDSLSFEKEHAKKRLKGFKFERDTRPPSPPLPSRSMTLLSKLPKLPFNRLRRSETGNSFKTAVEDSESVDEKGSVNEKGFVYGKGSMDTIGSVYEVERGSVDEKRKSCS